MNEIVQNMIQVSDLPLQIIVIGVLVFIIWKQSKTIDKLTDKLK